MSLRVAMRAIRDIYEERQRLRLLHTILHVADGLPLSEEMPDIVKAAGDDNLKLLHTCIKRGDNIDACDDNLVTPLMVAAWKNHVDFARVLLKHGAHPEAIGYDDERITTAMMIAIGRDHDMIVDALLEYGADPNGVVVFNHRAYLTTLAIAIDCQSIKSVERLLEYGADINYTDYQGLSAMHRACFSLVDWYPHGPRATLVPHKITVQPTYNYKASTGLKILEMVLMAKGANVNVRGRFWVTPLHIATYLGCTDAVMLLVEHGASATTIDYDKEIPACYSTHSHIIPELEIEHRFIEGYLREREGTIKLSVTPREQDDDGSECRLLAYSGALWAVPLITKLRARDCSAFREDRFVYSRNENAVNDAAEFGEVCPRLEIHTMNWNLSKKTFLAIHETETVPTIDIIEEYPPNVVQTMTKRYGGTTVRRKYYRYDVKHLDAPPNYDKNRLWTRVVVSSFITLTTQHEIKLKRPAVLQIPHSLRFDHKHRRVRFIPGRLDEPRNLGYIPGRLTVLYKHLTKDSQYKSMSDWSVHRQAEERDPKSVTILLSTIPYACVFVVTYEYRTKQFDMSRPLRRVNFCLLGSQYLKREMRLKLVGYMNACSASAVVRERDRKTCENLVKWSVDVLGVDVRFEDEIKVRLELPKCFRLRSERATTTLCHSDSFLSQVYTSFELLALNTRCPDVDAFCFIETESSRYIMRLQVPTMMWSVFSREPWESFTSRDDMLWREQWFDLDSIIRTRVDMTWLYHRIQVYNVWDAGFSPQTSRRDWELPPQPWSRTGRYSTIRHKMMKNAEHYRHWPKTHVANRLDLPIDGHVIECAARNFGFLWKEIGLVLGYFETEIEWILSCEHDGRRSTMMRLILEHWSKGHEEGYGTLGELIAAFDDEDVFFGSVFRSCIANKKLFVY